MFPRRKLNSLVVVILLVVLYFLAIFSLISFICCCNPVQKHYKSALIYQSPIDTLKIQWEKVPGTEYYIFQILLDKDIILTDSTNQTYYPVPVSDSGSYEVRVKAVTKEGESDWHSSKDTTAALGGWIFYSSGRLN